MTAVHENDELHRLVDRLTPGQARRLLALAKADAALAAADADSAVAGAEGDWWRVMRPFRPMAEPGLEGDALTWFRSFAGSVDSGRDDLSDGHEEIIRGGLTADG